MCWNHLIPAYLTPLPGGGRDPLDFVFEGVWKVICSAPCMPMCSLSCRSTFRVNQINVCNMLSPVRLIVFRTILKTMLFMLLMLSQQAHAEWVWCVMHCMMRRTSMIYKKAPNKGLTCWLFLFVFLRHSTACLMVGYMTSWKLGLLRFEWYWTEEGPFPAMLVISTGAWQTVCYVIHYRRPQHAHAETIWYAQGNSPAGRLLFLWCAHYFYHHHGVLLSELFLLVLLDQAPWSGTLLA